MTDRTWGLWGEGVQDGGLGLAGWGGASRTAAWVPAALRWALCPSPGQVALSEERGPRESCHLTVSAQTPSLSRSSRPHFLGPPKSDCR